MNTRIAASLSLVLVLGCVESEPINDMHYVATSTAAELGHDDAANPVLMQATVAACPGVEPIGIESYDGIVGYYTRLYPYADDELVTLHIHGIEHDPEWIGVRGAYAALVKRDGAFGFDSGAYLAVPNNPAIGPAMAFDVDGDETVDELYWVLGVTRNAFGNIDRMCMGKSRSDGSGQPFLLSRLGL